MATSVKKVPSFRRSRPSLAAITIEGFKSINSECRLELGSLNILAGANSAGKSSFLQPLLLLKQTVEAAYDPGPLLIDGPNVKFTELAQIFSKVAGAKRQLSIGLYASDGRGLKLSFGIGTKKQLQIKENIHTDRKGKSQILTEGLSNDEVKKIVKASGFPSSSMFAQHEASIGRDRAFLRLQFTAEDRTYMFPVGIVDGFGEDVGRNIIHVPGLRGNPERSYKKTAVGGSFPGTLDTYVASIVANWQEYDHEKLETLGRQLLQLGLTWKVTSKKIDDTRVELQVGRLPTAAQGGARDLVSIADVGFGVSQVLPVLVALLVAKPGQMVYIEQPETHLHPKAQRALAAIFAEAVQRQSVVIVETHSLLFVRAIQTLVARGEVEKDVVKLHWVERDAVGQTQVTTRDLDESGAYGDWPQDFEATEMAGEQDFIEAAEAVLLNHG